jgi:ketosteroid isomerase-like protein
MEHEDLAGWIDAYERAWRTPGTALLAELFADGSTYLAAPFTAPMHGREAIASFWEAERESAEEVFALEWQPVAVEGDVGVARVEVRYGGPPAREYRDLWIVTLDADGRCSAFEEWPFFPGQERVTGGPG